MKVTAAASGIGLVTSYLILLYIATEVKGYFQNELIDENLPTDKRYAMLSYSYGGRGRNNYNSKRYRYRSYWKPWLNLPDRRCYRQSCSSNYDCCMRYNKCDPYQKFCLDCWYGAQCDTSADCCYRFPYCNSKYNYCTN